MVSDQFELAASLRLQMETNAGVFILRPAGHQGLDFFPPK